MRGAPRSRSRIAPAKRRLAAASRAAPPPSPRACPATVSPRSAAPPQRIARRLQCSSDIKGSSVQATSRAPRASRRAREQVELHAFAATATLRAVRWRAEGAEWGVRAVGQEERGLGAVERHQRGVCRAPHFVNRCGIWSRERDETRGGMDMVLLPKNFHEQRSAAVRRGRPASPGGRAETCSGAGRGRGGVLRGRGGLRP